MGLKRVLLGKSGDKLPAAEHEPPGAGGGMGTQAGQGGAQGSLGNAWLQSQLQSRTGQDTSPSLEQATTGAVGEDTTLRDRLDRFTAGTYSVQNQALDGYGNFDLDYAPKANNTTVVVRLKFAFESGTPNPGEDVADYTWSDEAKDTWKADFMSEVETAWSGQHGFGCVNPSDAGLLACPTWSDLQPGVVIDIQEVDSGEHFVVHVTKIPTGGFQGSSVTRPRRDASGAPTGSGSAQMDSEDLTPANKGGGPGVRQRGGIHEFGHMIGNQDEYISGSRPEGTQTRQGNTVGPMSDSVMSGGETILEEHYGSILDALNAAVSGHGVVFDFA